MDCLLFDIVPLLRRLVIFEQESAMRIHVVIFFILLVGASVALTRVTFAGQIGTPESSQHQEAIFPASPSDLSPIVLALDGMDWSSTFEELPSALNLMPDSRISTYLEPAIEKHWGLSDAVYSVFWTGDAGETEAVVRQVKTVVLVLVKKAESEGRPFVVVTHSWGSVLAYRALVELYRDGKIKASVVDQLVTMGSPFNAQSYIVRTKTQQFVKPPFSHSDTLAFREWRNYYADADCASGAIPGAGISNTKLSIDEPSCRTAHHAYYKDPDHFRRIGRDILEGIRTRKEIREGRERLIARSTATSPEPSADPPVEEDPSVLMSAKYPPECQSGYVTVLAGETQCGFLLKEDGSLHHLGSSISDPIVVSAFQSADGDFMLFARKIILFPPSPSGRYRIIKACDDVSARALCWKVLAFDAETKEIGGVYAGKYGPKEWITWSEDEEYAVLINQNDGVNWLNFVKVTDFVTAIYPAYEEKVDVIVDRSSFQWLDPRTVKVRVARCTLPYCEGVTLEEDGYWATLRITENSIVASTEDESDRLIAGHDDESVASGEEIAGPEWGPEIVPDPSIELGYRPCADREVRRCLSELGLSEEAIEFSFAFDPQNTGEFVAVAFIELGKVDLVMVNTPYAPWVAPVLVNGEPDLIRVEVRYRNLGSQFADSASRSFLSRHPDANAMALGVLGHRTLPSGGQRFVLASIVTASCRACPIVGSAVAFLDFDADGRKVEQRAIGLMETSRVDFPAQEPWSAAELAKDPRALQYRLNLLGYEAGPMDGIPGRMTSEALRAFQIDNCLPATGELDDGTTLRLSQVSDFGEPCLETAQPQAVSAGPAVPVPAGTGGIGALVNTLHGAHGPGPVSDPAAYFAGQFHLGIDLRAPADTEVTAPVSGEIVYYHRLAGNGQPRWLQTFLVLRGDDGRDWLLGHMDCTVCDRTTLVGDAEVWPTWLRRRVTQGEPVGRIAPLAEEGYGAHLHMGVVAGSVVDAEGVLMPLYRGGEWARLLYDEADADGSAAARDRAAALGFVDPLTLYAD